MLDTNICVYVLKNCPEQLREKFNRLAGQLCISMISLAELLYGVENHPARMKTAKRSSNWSLGSVSCHSRRRRPLITGKLGSLWRGPADRSARTTC